MPLTKKGEKIKKAMDKGDDDAIQTREDMKEAIARRDALQREIESELSLFTAETTREKLAVLLAGQNLEAMASITSEARGVVDIVNGKYGESSDEDFYCSAYSGDPCKVGRMSRETISLKRPCLSISWAIQPDKLESMMGNETMVESGFLARFLMARCVTTQLEGTGRISEATTSEYHDLMVELLDTYRNAESTHVIEPAEEAHVLFVEMKRDVNRRCAEGGDLADMDPYPSRWVENAWRLALVLHTATHGRDSHNHDLSHSMARDAIEIAQWFQSQQLGILSSGRDEKRWKRLEKLIELIKRKGGAIPLWRLKEKHGFSESEIRTLVIDFPRQVEVVENKETGGRPSRHAKLYSRQGGGEKR